MPFWVGEAIDVMSLLEPSLLRGVSPGLGLEKQHSSPVWLLEGRAVRWTVVTGCRFGLIVATGRSDSHGTQPLNGTQMRCQVSFAAASCVCAA